MECALNGARPAVPGLELALVGRLPQSQGGVIELPQRNRIRQRDLFQFRSQRATISGSVESRRRPPVARHLRMSGEPAGIKGATLCFHRATLLRHSAGGKQRLEP